MPFTLEHKSLGTTLNGVELPSAIQFRGIPYGSVPARFEKPEPLAKLPATLDCTRYGPRCPQLPVDVGYLLRIPREHTLPSEPEDEFTCLNLDVVVPTIDSMPAAQSLPVLVWIHGGSQAMTFGSAASGVCDMTSIVSDALSLGKPIIAVSVQYRLNIFAFGDDTSTRNLALQDQSLALEWVWNHIRDFGGDPGQITLAGESAGAVYCHAHLVADVAAKQFILSSGSLHLSPPQPVERASAMRNSVREKLKELGDFNLHTAPADMLVKAVEKTGIQSWFLQVDAPLEDWQTKTGNNAQRLLLSDVQNEAAIWRAGMWSAGVDAIVGAFDLAGEERDQLKSLYQIYLDRPSSCKIGALDFINDYKFVLPVEKLVQQWRAVRKPVFRCLIDEPNPWQPSNGAQHAVDLVLLFGGFDQSLSGAARQTGKQMREKWIHFINWEQPWHPNSYVAFGPHGAYGEVDQDGLRSRRRMEHVEYLGRADPNLLDKAFGALAAGKISLLN